MITTVARPAPGESEQTPGRGATGLSFGLTARRRGWMPRREQFTNLLMGGLQEVAVSNGHSVVFRVVEDEVEERRVREHWARTGAVDAFVVQDVTEAAELDPIKALGLPFVLLGDASQRTWHRATVTEDDAALMREVVRFLQGLNHHRIAWISGPMDRGHILARRAVFDAQLGAQGATGAVYPGDYSVEHVTGAIEAELRAAEGPRAVILDGDYLAVTAQKLLAEAGHTPPETALLAWQDSRQCQLADTPITALNHHVDGLGRVLGQALIEVGSGQEEVHLQGPVAELFVRGTTAELQLPPPS